LLDSEKHFKLGNIYRFFRDFETIDAFQTPSAALAASSIAPPPFKSQSLDIEMR